MMTESNRRHSACKADALPTELITLVAAFAKTLLNQKSIRCASFIFQCIRYFLANSSFQKKLDKFSEVNNIKIPKKKQSKAQLVERLPYKQNVGGSTPSSPTKFPFIVAKQ